MRTIVTPVLLLLVLASCSEQTPVTYEGRPSDLRIPASDLNGSWRDPTGFLVDDLSDLSETTEPTLTIAKQLAKQSPTLEGCADFTYRSSESLMNAVTVRVFIFDTPANCAAWWSQKYEQPGSAELYKSTGGANHALDSKQMKKRIVRIGNVVLTSHQLHEGEDYLAILNSYVERLKSS